MPTNSTLQILRDTASRDLAPGHRRFIAQLSRLLPCLEKAAAAREQARALYETPARQCFFYLQALCRIYREVQDKKPFKALGEEFKAAEDQLGKVDYWDGWLKDGGPLSPKQTAAIERHKAAELAKLQLLLDDAGWLARDFARLRDMLGDLEKVDWHKASKDRRKIADFLAEELDDLDDDFRDGEFDFEDVELGIHEFRRKLRWISIYAQALDGLIQLRPASSVDARLRPYMTKEVLESRYNVLPAPEPGIEPLHFGAPHFYAMSWVVAELGTIKDAGLKAEAMHELARELGDIAGGKKPESAAAAVSKIANTFIVENEILRRLREDIEAS